MNIPKVLIVIPCLNEAQHIKSLLDSLKMLQNTDIVVADGGSSDGTQSIVLKMANENNNIVLLDNIKKIQSAAINLAVDVYGKDAKYLVRLDAHGEYPENFVIDLVNEAETIKTDSIVVSMDTIGKTPFQQVVAITQNSKLGNGGSSHRNESAEGKWIEHGHHALMTLEAFKAVGGYDESFVANEDAELDFRLTAAGYKIWLTAKTHMKYYPRTSFKSLYVQYYKYGIGRASNVLKHKQIPKVRQLIPLSVFPCLLLSLLSPVSSFFLIPFLSWFLICISYGAYLAFKERRSTLVLTGLVAATMHMGWSIGFCIRLIGLGVRNSKGKAL